MISSTIQLKVETGGAAARLRSLDQATNRLNRSTGDLQRKLGGTSQGLVGVGRASKAATAGMKGTAVAAKGLQAAIAPLLAALTVFQAGSFVITKTAELETQTRSIQLLTGSLEDTKRVIGELKQFSAVTPFTSSELIETSKQLAAFGVETQDLVTNTKQLGDLAGATGARINELATAYGQVVAKGRLQTEELLQFQGRGVGVQAELQRMYNLSGEELQKAISKGQVSAEAFREAIRRLTAEGGKYANGAVAQSDTLAGRFSTLQDAVGRLAVTLGQVLQPAIMAVLNTAISATESVLRLLGAAKGARDLTPKKRRQIEQTAIQRARRAVPGGAQGDPVSYGLFSIPRLTPTGEFVGEYRRQKALLEQQAVQEQFGTGLIKNLKTEPFNIPKLTGGTVAGGGGGGGAAAAAAAASALRDEQQAYEAAMQRWKAAAGLLETAQQQRAVAEAQAGISRDLVQDDVDRGRIQSKYNELLAEATREDTKQTLERAKQLELDTVQLKAQERILAIRKEFERSRVSGEVDIQRRLGEAQIANTVLRDGGNLEKLLDLNRVDLEINEQRLDIAEKLSAARQSEAEGAAGVVKEYERQLAALPRIAAARKDGIEQLYEMLEVNRKLAQQQEDNRRIFDSIGDSIKTGFVEGINAAIKGTESLRNVLSRMFEDLSQKLLDIGLNFLLFGSPFGQASGGGGLLGGLFGGLFGGFRASGGPVSKGRAYVVGENGPELFTPSSSGTITPNRSMGGRDGGMTTISVNVDAGGTKAEGDDRKGGELGRLIGAAIQAELVKQKRPGGILYS